MQVKPPPITQAPAANQIAQGKTDLPLVENGIIENNDAEGITKAPLQSEQTPTIYKGRIYRKYVKLCREGKYISARITAKAIGVAPSTLIEWNKTKAVQEAIQEDINRHVERMKVVGDKDWKMHDKLIDRALDITDKDAERATTLNNLIQINIVSPDTT